MSMQTVSSNLSPLQLELLKVYSFHPSQEDLLAIKKMLADYFAKKLIDQIAVEVKEKNISEKDLENWLNEPS